MPADDQGYPSGATDCSQRQPGIRRRDLGPAAAAHGWSGLSPVFPKRGGTSKEALEAWRFPPDTGRPADGERSAGGGAADWEVGGTGAWLRAAAPGRKEKTQE